MKTTLPDPPLTQSPNPDRDQDDDNRQPEGNQRNP